MDFQIGLVITGLTVGFIVGLTGVGGGSLMTPILLWFGIPPTTAVLIYSMLLSLKWAVFMCIIKKRISIGPLLPVSLGSVPAALLTLWILHTIKTDITALNAIIKYSLGWALLLPRLLYFSKKLMNFSQKHSGDKFHTESRTQNVLTVAIGLVLL
jgi:uncharacterized membrane protein YfcA